MSIAQANVKTNKFPPKPPATIKQNKLIQAKINKNKSATPSAKTSPQSITNAGKVNKILPSAVKPEQKKATPPSTKQNQSKPLPIQQQKKSPTNTSAKTSQNLKSKFTSLDALVHEINSYTPDINKYKKPQKDMSYCMASNKGEENFLKLTPTQFQALESFIFPALDNPNIGKLPFTDKEVNLKDYDYNPTTSKRQNIPPKNLGTAKNCTIGKK